MGTTVQRKYTLDLLKVLLCVGIVVRHAELVGMVDRSAAFAGFNRGMMLFTELCVPMFFVISGYLFFLNVPEKPNGRYFVNKIRSRVFTLLVPYLIANAIAFLCYWLAHRFAPDMIAGFFGENWKHPLFIFWTGPINLSLWFIRDLMYSILLSPVIYFFVRYTRIWGVIGIGLLWFFQLLPLWINFCFILGAWAAVHRVDAENLCRKTGPWFLLIYICAFIVAYPVKSAHLIALVLLAGLPICLYAASRLMSVFKWNIPVGWQAWCFFMYLYHYIPEIFFKKVLNQFLDPGSFWSLMLVFVLVSVLTLVSVTGLFWVMKKWLPRTTRVLVGGKL